MPSGIGTSGLAENQVFKIKRDNELLRESIYNILTTRKGERVGNPEFGSDIFRYIFEPNIEPFWEAIKIEIIKDVQRFEPRVIVLNIDVAASPDEHLASVYVTFYSLLTGDIEEIGVTNLA